MDGHTKKYLLCPGSVRSRHDGQVHWVSAPELAHLYHVPMSECVVTLNDARRAYRDDLTVLEPNCHGRYTLPT